MPLRVKEPLVLIALKIVISWETGLKTNKSPTQTSLACVGDYYCVINTKCLSPAGELRYPDLAIMHTTITFVTSFLFVVWTIPSLSG